MIVMGWSFLTKTSQNERQFSFYCELDAIMPENSGVFLSTNARKTNIVLREEQD